MKDQRGQSLIMVSVVIVILLAFVGLAIDGGNAYLQRRQLQTAADAGALSAARVWCLDHGADWQTVGNTYCSLNAADSTGYAVTCVTDVGPDAPVRVTASAAVPTWFIRILGGDLATINVRAEAQANCGPVVETSTFWPMAVAVPLACDPNLSFEECFQTYENPVELWDKESDKYEDCLEDPTQDQCDDVTGGYGWLDLPSECGGGGARAIGDMIEDPACAPPLHLPDWYDAKTGVNASQLDLHDWCGTPVPIPIYREMHGPPDFPLEYYIEAVAAFTVTGVCVGPHDTPDGACPGFPTFDCTNQDKKIRGDFVEITTEGYADDDAYDTGVYVVYLVR